MTVTVPTIVLALPLLLIVGVSIYLATGWAWERYLDPVIFRWIYRRHCARLRRIGFETPTFNEFCGEFAPDRSPLFGERLMSAAARPAGSHTPAPGPAWLGAPGSTKGSGAARGTGAAPPESPPTG